KDKGIIGFVTNASFIDGQTTDGLRKHWHNDFNYIYIYNLRGNQRTIGELSRQEGGKIFDSGSRAPIAITLLVKDGSSNHKIYYNEVNDYLTRKEKLSEIANYKSIQNIMWSEIKPNNQYDWINQRDENYVSYTSLVEEDNSVFNEKLTGVNTSRDDWVYGFSKNEIIKNSHKLIENYNNEVNKLSNIKSEENHKKINLSPSYINWSRSLRNKIQKNEKIVLEHSYDKYLVLSQYRPFVKKWLYYQRDIVEMPGKYLTNNINSGEFNLIQTTGKGATRGFSSIIINHIPNFDMMNKGQGYMLEYTAQNNGLELQLDNYNLNETFSTKVGLSREDTFYYVYGILHSKDYINRYYDNLTKEVPRIPQLSNKEKFVQVGKRLALLHLNYEDVPAYDSLDIQKKNQPSYKVAKMKFDKIRNHEGRLINNKSSIIYNGDITINNIPEKAYE